MMHFSRLFPFRGQLALTLQMLGGVVLLKLALLFSMVLLCLEIRFAMLAGSCSSILRYCCCRSCAIEEWAESFWLDVDGIPTDVGANLFTIWWVEP